MTDRDRQRLKGVHPDLVAALMRIFDEMHAAGAEMFVVQGVRTDLEQARLYAQGRTAPGQIVTYKDGIHHRSDHQPYADGWGHAVDLAFVGSQPFDHRHPWELYGEKAEECGLIWGGRWKMVDRPHVELPEKLTNALRA